jgi:hypothetical protein
MRPDRVRTLAGLFVSRMARQIGAVAVALSVLVAIDLLKNGFRPSSLLGWFFGAAIMIPPMQGFVVARDKMDGTLHFLASLPIAGREHVAARVLVGAVFAIPALVLTVIGLHANVPQFSLAQDLLMGVAVWAGLTIVSLALIALQLRTTFGNGVRVMIYLFLAFIIAGRVLSGAAKDGRFSAMRDWVLTATGLALASLAFWMMMTLLAGWAGRTIARISESYEGEPTAVS